MAPKFSKFIIDDVLIYKGVCVRLDAINKNAAYSYRPVSKLPELELILTQGGSVCFSCMNMDEREEIGLIYEALKTRGFQGVTIR